MPDTIRDYLADDSWQERFDAHVVEEGAKIARQRRVSDLELESLEDGGAILTARVSTPQDEAGEVEISFWSESVGWNFDTTCSCPYTHFCRHAAATLAHASKPAIRSRLFKTGGASFTIPSADTSSPGEAATSTRPAVRFPARFSLTVAFEPATSRPAQLLLQALRSPERNFWLVARPSVHYGDHELALLRQPGQEVRIDTPGGPATLEPDLAAEHKAIDLLHELGLTNLASNPSYRFLLGIARKDRDGEVPEANAWFPEPSLSTPDVYWPWFRTKGTAKLRSHHWDLTIDDDIGHRVYPVESGDWQTSLEELPGGWFTLSVGFDLDGERLDLLPILAELLESDTLDLIKDQPDDARHLVYLPQGGALHIPVGRLRNILGHLSALVDPSKPVLHPLDAATLAADPDLPIDPSPTLAKLARTLRERSGSKTPEPQEAPDTLQATLRPYQLDGFRWMRFLADHHLHGILADDMGLGKTVQTLAHLLAEKESGRALGKPSLVVAPTSVVPNWQAEARKFTPSLRVLVLQGPQRRKHFAAVPHADLVLTSFALLQRDIDKLSKIKFHLVILDEAQHIKNPSAKVAKAVLICDEPFRKTSLAAFCTSGTPSAM